MAEQDKQGAPQARLAKLFIKLSVVHNMHHFHRSFWQCNWAHMHTMPNSPGMQQRRQVDLCAAQHDRLQAWAGLRCARARARELPAQQRHNQRRAAQRCRQRAIRHHLHTAALRVILKVVKEKALKIYLVYI